MSATASGKPLSSSPSISESHSLPYRLFRPSPATDAIHAWDHQAAQCRASLSTIQEQLTAIRSEQKRCHTSAGSLRAEVQRLLEKVKEGDLLCVAVSAIGKKGTIPRRRDQDEEDDSDSAGVGSAATARRMGRTGAEPMGLPRRSRGAASDDGSGRHDDYYDDNDDDVDGDEGQYNRRRDPLPSQRMRTTTSRPSPSVAAVDLYSIEEDGAGRSRSSTAVIGSSNNSRAASPMSAKHTDHHTTTTVRQPKSSQHSGIESTAEDDAQLVRLLQEQLRRRETQLRQLMAGKSA